MANVLMDMAGKCCGAFEGDAPPQGYWVRDETAPDTLTPAEFLTRLGAANYAAVYAASQANPALLFMRKLGEVSGEIRIAMAFPQLIALETAGVIPQGTAIAMWGG